MVDVRAIFWATPVVGLEAQQIASVYGLPGLVPSWPGHTPYLSLYEPPSARREPVADAIEFLSLLQMGQGAEPDEARKRAAEAWREFAVTLGPLDRPVRLDEMDLLANTEGCAVRNLLGLGLANSQQLDFWTKALFAIGETRLYEADESVERRRLIDLPESPGPMEQFESVVSLPLSILYAHEPHGEWVRVADNWRYTQWRDRIRPIAERLQEVLGSWVWHFADFDDDTDDDSGHRLLILHMLASLVPESPFVKYMLEVSGAESVGALLAALEDPASYLFPFVSHDPFWNPDVSTVDIDASSVSTPRHVGLVADTAAACACLREHALAAIGDIVRIVTPPGSIDAMWCSEAAHHCLESSVHYGWDGALDALADCGSVTMIFDSEQDITDSGLRLALALSRSSKHVTVVGTNGMTYDNLQYSEAKKRGLL